MVGEIPRTTPLGRLGALSSDAVRVVCADAARAVAARPEISGFTVWQLTDCRSFHRGGATVRCKPFAENLAGIYDGYRRPKLPVVAAVRNAFLRLP